MRASKKSIASDLKRVDAHTIPPHEYDEASELTVEQLAQADLYDGGKLIRRGRPRLENPKQAVNLRLSPQVLEHFRSGGRGWQTRINAALERLVARERRKQG